MIQFHKTEDKMKNWVIILIIFIVPLALYGFIDYKNTPSEILAKVEEQAAIAKPIVYKFYSPLCKDCQTQSIEFNGLPEEFSETVIFENINVSGKEGESKKVKDLIKKFDIKSVPTIVIVDKNGKMVQKSSSVLRKNK